MDNLYPHFSDEETEMLIPHKVAWQVCVLADLHTLADWLQCLCALNYQFYASSQLTFDIDGN